MDDGGIAKAANQHIMGLQVTDRDRTPGLVQEAGAVDQPAVRTGAVEVAGQDPLEAPDVAALHRGDLVPVQSLQSVNI